MKKKQTRGKNVTRVDYDKFISEHNEIHRKINDSLIQLHTKLDTISSVQVNGRKGLNESLQDIYELTKELRNERNLKIAFKNWQETSTLGKLYKTKLGKTSLYVTITFLALSVAHSVNFIPTSPIDVFIKLFEFFVKFI